MFSVHAHLKRSSFKYCQYGPFHQCYLHLSIWRVFRLFAVIGSIQAFELLLSCFHVRPISVLKVFPESLHFLSLVGWSNRRCHLFLQTLMLSNLHDYSISACWSRNTKVILIQIQFGLSCFSLMHVYLHLLTLISTFTMLKEANLGCYSLSSSYSHWIRLFTINDKLRFCTRIYFKRQAFPNYHSGQNEHCINGKGPCLWGLVTGFHWRNHPSPPLHSSASCLINMLHCFTEFENYINKPHIFTSVEWLSLCLV